MFYAIVEVFDSMMKSGSSHNYQIFSINIHAYYKFSKDR